MGITWDKFKEYVDQELRKQGKTGIIPIEYIDMRGWEIDPKNIKENMTIWIDLNTLRIS